LQAGRSLLHFAAQGGPLLSLLRARLKGEGLEVARAALLAQDQVGWADQCCELAPSSARHAQLVAARSDLSASDGLLPQGGCTALHHALAAGNVEGARLLVSMAQELCCSDEECRQLLSHSNKVSTLRFIAQLTASSIEGRRPS
jgi:hypothetical protein